MQCLTVDSAKLRPALYNTAAQAAPMSAFRLQQDDKHIMKLCIQIVEHAKQLKKHVSIYKH